MALLWLDGFDQFNSQADILTIYPWSSGCGISTNSGRFGGCAVAITGAVEYIDRSGLEENEIWSGFSCLLSSYRVASIIAEFLCVYTEEIDEIEYVVHGVEMSVWYSSLYGFWYVNNSVNQTIYQCVYPMLTNVWYWFDIYYNVEGSFGEFNMYLNGTRVPFIATNVKNQYGQTANLVATGTELTISNVRLGSADNNTMSPAYFDDWYISSTSGTVNNTHINDARIETLFPNSDYGPNQGTPSTPGPHYLMVNNLDWINSNNNVSVSSGEEEIYTLSSLSEDPQNIYGVTLAAVGSGPGVGGIILSENGNNMSTSTLTDESNANVITLETFTYDYYGSVWTTSNINALLVGISVTG